MNTLTAHQIRRLRAWRQYLPWRDRIRLAVRDLAWRMGVLHWLF